MNTKARRKAWHLLLALPYVAMLWVPSYNRVDPSWMGIPFFYWYQLLWVVFCSLVVAVVFRMTRAWGG